MWQENLLWGQKGKELPHHSPYLVHNHRAFRERSAGRTFYIRYHFIIFKNTACVLTVMSNEEFSQGSWDCVFRSFVLTVCLGFFFVLSLDWLLLCSIDFPFSVDEQDKMIKKERSMCQQTRALLHKNFLRKWRMKKESVLVWFTIYIFPYLVNENPSFHIMPFILPFYDHKFYGLADLEFPR